MKIGIVGSQPGVEMLHSIIRRREMFIEILPFPTDVEYVADVVRQIQPEVDGILFTGNDPYSFANEYVKATVPWATATISTNSVLQTLLTATMSGADIHHISFDLKAISVDQMANLIAGGDANAMDDLRVFRYGRTDDISITSADYLRDVVAFHSSILSSGKADLCLSATSGVAEALRKRGYKAFAVRPTEETVCNAINELFLKHEVSKYKEELVQSGIAALLIEARLTDNFTHGMQGYQHLTCLHQIEMSIFEFAGTVRAAVEKQSENRYLIYTTNAELVHETHNYTRMPILQKIASIANVKCTYAAVGLGESPADVRRNAFCALEAAIKRNYSNYYIMGADETIFGPFGIEVHTPGTAYSETRLSKISEETGINITILNAINRAKLQYEFDTITPGRLAKLCNMTISNTNRVISLLEKQGYAEIVGYTPTNGAGRPSRLIRIQWARSSQIKP